MSGRHGFTLIELIVVIAIIGILASVILPRLNTARDRAIETKIIAELESFHKTAMSEVINSSSFNVICGMNGVSTSTKLVKLAQSLQETSEQFVCNSNLDAFAASAQVNGAEHRCVDNAGAKGPVANALAAGVTTCD